MQAGKGPADCFWVDTLSPTTFNVRLPDLGVPYWISQFKLPAGATLELKGQCPYSRCRAWAFRPCAQVAR